MAIWCLLCSIVLEQVLVAPANVLAQCATCRAGGKCAKNHGGQCLANRTFWGYYQGNWRKWPTVEAEEQAAAEAPRQESPADVAPSSVLPKPEDEARSAPDTSRTPAIDEAKREDSNGVKLPGETPIKPAPESSIPQTEIPKKIPLNELPGEKLPDFGPPSTPKQVPDSGTAKPSRPGSLLDDPAPVPPIDPNDRVPSLPPSLQDLKPEADAPSLEDLFPPDKTDAPKLPGGAATPQGNEPGEVAKTTSVEEKPAASNPESPSFTSGVLGIAPAAANSASAAPAANVTLDQMATLERTAALPGKISPRSASLLPSDTSKEPEISQEHGPAGLPQEEASQPGEALEPEEPSLLLLPTDTTEVKNPLRDEVIHARYAARMFTPQVASAKAGTEAVRGEKESVGLGNEMGSLNPLRSENPHRMRSLREVVPVGYEEPVANEAGAPDESASTLSPMPLPTTQSSAASQEAEKVVEKTEPEEKGSPSQVNAFDGADSTTVETFQPIASELPRERLPVEQTYERKAPVEGDSTENQLRSRRASEKEIHQDNPLRSGSQSSSKQPGKVLGTGRYVATLPSPSASPEIAERPAPTQVQEYAPISRQRNPLRTGL